MSTYQVGQELWWEPSDRRERILGCRMVKIVKVGRVWLELSNGYKVDKIKLAAYSKIYGPPGHCYLDRAARELHVAAELAWSKLCRKLCGMHNIPSHLTLAEITQAAALLGVTI